MPQIEEQSKYLEIIDSIAENFKIMKKIRPLKPEEVQRFYDDFAITTAYSSNAIEGNTFTYDETRLLLKEGVVASERSYLEHKDIEGTFNAWNHMYSFLKDNSLPTEEFVKKIHSSVLQGREFAGIYRTKNVVIGDMFKNDYVAPDFKKVDLLMSNYITRLQLNLKELSGLKSRADIDWVDTFNTLARHHIEFEKIHPFIDGNGRTGRLLLNYELIFLGLLPIDVRYSMRDRYYSAFKKYDDKLKYGKSKYSTTDAMAKLFLEAELNSMVAWNKTFLSEREYPGKKFEDNLLSEKELLLLNKQVRYEECDKAILVNQRFAYENDICDIIDIINISNGKDDAIIRKCGKLFLEKNFASNGPIKLDLDKDINSMLTDNQTIKE